ncbi:MAG: acetyltransferase [Bdellovibrio sp.]|nr:acetyltransferase [Bdellovibrio sp.]
MKYFHVHSKNNFNVALQDAVLTVEGAGQNLQFQVESNGGTASLSTKSAINANEPATLVAMEYLFGHNTELQTISLNQNAVARADFFQNPSLWCQYGVTNLKPEQWTKTGEVSHPVRPTQNPGELLYSRYVPSIQKTVSFRVMNVEKDLKTFHFWQNQPYVYEFWELNKPESEIKEYIEKGLKDPHYIPTFVEFDGIPVGYFEMYWTKEDRLGPYYDSEAFDRGFHLLIGNTDFLGFPNTDAILKSATHYLFLEEPRTRKIMAEPRSDNKRIIRYIETFTAWKKLKEFDFPHKRAALLECRREAFFMGNFL